MIFLVFDIQKYLIYFNKYLSQTGMADIIKVKAKKQYEWNQDKKYLYIQVPLPAHTSLKKVEIYLSDLILRVTSLQKKQTHFLDLLHQIDYRSPENKFILTNGLLHATLRKSQSDLQWSSLLIEDISLADLKQRRRESEIRYEQSNKQVEETKDKLRLQYDRKATQQLMRFEQQQREQLDLKKKIEKDQAIRQVFSGINEKTGKIQKPQKKLQFQRDQDKWRQKQKIALQILDKQEQTERLGYSQQIKSKAQTKIIQQVKKQFVRQKNANDTMFTEQEINKFQEQRKNLDNEIQVEEIPIRRGNKQKITFTQKVYPHLAARDTFHKQPPMPKSKGGKASAGDLQQKNPLWLKDKGDGFYRDKNFVSAIEAYSEAIKLDSKLVKAYLNRSLSYLKIFKLQEAINDCDQCLILMQSELLNSEQQKASSRLILAKIKARKAICLAWKGQIEPARLLFNQISQLQLDPQIKDQLSSCLEQLKARQQSIQSKLKGDQFVKLNNYQNALAKYDKSIQIDHNEYALSNKVLCLNKLKDYRNAIETAIQGIKKITRFNVATDSSTKDKESSILLLKLHYRKAKAHQQLGQINEAQDQIRKGLTVNSQDKDLKQFLVSIKKKQSKQNLKKLKQEAVTLIKQSKIKEALQIYGKCLKLLEENQDLSEYIAILQNNCVCYQKLQKFDDVLATCIRILKLVNTIESKVLVFGGKKEIPIEKEQLKKISVRTLMRRANAYIKTGQYYNAKSDFQKALELNQDEKIKKQIETLYEKLKSQLQS